MLFPLQRSPSLLPLATLALSASPYNANPVVACRRRILEREGGRGRGCLCAGAVRGLPRAVAAQAEGRTWRVMSVACSERQVAWWRRRAMMMQNKVREMLPHYYTRWTRCIAQYVSSMRRAIAREAEQAPSRCTMVNKKGGGQLTS